MAAAKPNAPDPKTPEARHQALSPNRATSTNYGQILKSSAWIAGSSAIVVAIGIVRTKTIAILLGPAGFGLMALYSSILDLALSLASMGVGNSGVRQIAESAASGDTDRVATTAAVLRRLAYLLGIVGAAVVAFFASRISLVTFGDEEHRVAIMVLALAVLVRLIGIGQGALLQGLRRIRELAAANVLGAALGAAVTVAVVYAWRTDGVAPSIALSAVVGLCVSWWYVRRLKIQRPDVARTELLSEGTALIKLGGAFMASSLVMMGSNYFARSMLVQTEGLEAAGLYQAAWAVAGVYVGFVLQAMGADFYPRLVGVIGDAAESNRVVNEQAHVSLLLAGPGVIATIIAAPLIVSLFYTATFTPAVEVLRWLCLGVALRVVTWPMGYIIVAQNNRRVFVAAELAWGVFNVGATWLCLQKFGLNGAGIAFFASYVFHGILVYPIVRRLNGFRWSWQNLKAGGIYVAIVGATFGSTLALHGTQLLICGTLLFIASSTYSTVQMLHLTETALVPAPVKRKLERLAQSWERLTAWHRKAGKGQM